MSSLGKQWALCGSIHILERNKVMMLQKDDPATDGTTKDAKDEPVVI